ncbi:MAG: PRC-barrel domain-containing protein [Maritimibacter harenae]
MLISYDDLRHYAIRAADERTGRVQDIYFDDHAWKVRYLVAHTGFLLVGRESLVGAEKLGKPDTERAELPVDLTAEELKSAETPETAAPVSEQEKQRAIETGIWPQFIVGPGVAFTPVLAQEQLADVWAAGDNEPKTPEPRPGDPNLRSMHEVTGYKVSATDGEIGSVSDFLVDPEDWAVKHLVIDTGSWLPGKRVVITSDWVTEVDWTAGRIHVDVNQNAIEESPELTKIEDLCRSHDDDPLGAYGTLGLWPM